MIKLPEMKADEKLRKALSVLHRKSQYGLQSIRLVSKIFADSDDAKNIFKTLPTTLKEIFNFEYIFISNITNEGSVELIKNTSIQNDDLNYFLNLLKEHLNIAGPFLKTKNDDDHSLKIKSYAVIPIEFKKQITAAILFADTKYRADLPIIVDTISLIGDMLAQEINRRELLEEIGQVNRDKVVILDNLEQSLMVCDEKGAILPGCSLAAKKMFGENIEGNTIFNVFQYNPKAEESLSSWLKLIFKDVMDFSNVKPLGPSFYEKPNGMYIKLDYNIIRNEDGKVDRLLIKGSDDTEKRRLGKIAEEETSFAKSALLIVKNVYEFKLLTENIRKSIKILKNLIDKQSNPDTLESISKTLHTFKGNCGIFSLTSIANIIDLLEDEIADFFQADHKSNETCKLFSEQIIKEFESGFEKHIVRYDEILELFNEDELEGKFISNAQLTGMSDFIRKEYGEESELFSEYTKQFLLEPFHDCFKQYSNLVTNQSKLLGKKIDFSVENTDILIKKSCYAGFLSSMIHILRNAIDHGFERPKIRIDIGKKEVGSITVSFERELVEAQEYARIAVSDDGVGIDTGKVKSQVLENGHFTVSEVAAMSAHEINQLIFLPYFSTKGCVSTISGRGVGLNAVKDEVAKIKGKIWVESKDGEGAQFIILVPILQN